MSTVFRLRFGDSVPVVTGSWPLAVSPSKVVTTALRPPLDLDGEGQLAWCWPAAAGRRIVVDTSANEAVLAESALVLHLRHVSLEEPVAVVTGTGAPMEVTLSRASTGFTVAATLRATAPAVTLSAPVAAIEAGTTLEIAVLVSGRDAVLVVQGTAVARAVLASPCPDRRGKVAVAGPPKGGASGLTVLAVSLDDHLTPAHEALVEEAAESGLGEIDAFVRSDAARYLGRPVGDEVVVEGIRLRRFENGVVYWSAASGVHDVSGEALSAYEAEGGFLGRLGLPTSQAMPLDSMMDLLDPPKQRGPSGILQGDVARRVPAVAPLRSPVDFERLRSAEPAAAPPARVDLGRAVSPGFLRDFDASAPLVGSRISARDVSALLKKAAAGPGVSLEFDGDRWSVVGLRAQMFEHGMIVSTARGAFVLSEPIVARWIALGGSRGFLGVPQGGEVTTASRYEGPEGSRSVAFGGGSIWWSAQTGAHEVHGAILEKYLQKSSDEPGFSVPPWSAVLGAPVADEAAADGIRGARVSRFHKGSIFWTPARGAMIVQPPLLDGFLLGGGLRRWGMPVEPARWRTGDGATIHWQVFEHGVLAHSDHVGWFDSMRVSIGRVEAGEIDDSGFLEPRDVTAELYVRASVTADGESVGEWSSPRDGTSDHVAPGDWTTREIPLRADLRVDVHIEAWDHDALSADDHLADHDRTFALGDDLFGYASTRGTYIDQASTWNDSAHAGPGAITFSYSVSPSVRPTLSGLREHGFFRFANRGRPRLPWDLFRRAFADVSDAREEDADFFYRWFYSLMFERVGETGNCFGFSLSALDAFLNVNDLREPLSDDSTTYGDADPTWQVINRAQGAQRAFGVLSHLSEIDDEPDHRDPRRVWARIRSALDESGQPVILTLQGRRGNTHVGHAVLVYGTAVTPSGDLVLYHADSNRPWAIDAATAEGSKIVIHPDGSYEFPGQPDYAGAAWVDGLLPETHMVEIPGHAVAEPRLTPLWFLQRGFIGLVAAIVCTFGAEVEQVEAGGHSLFGDHRAAVLERLATREQRAASLARALGIGAEELSARLVGGAASSAWREIGRLDPGVAAALRADLGRRSDGPRVRTPAAWPEATLITGVDTGEEPDQLVVVRGRVPRDIVVTVVGTAAPYHHTFLTRGGLIAVDAALDRGERDVLLGRGLRTECAGVQITSDSTPRLARTTLANRDAASRGRASVWQLPLGVGAGAGASARWIAGRPGLIVRHATIVPPGVASMSVDGLTRTYALPTIEAGEQLRILPQDPASPGGALRVQRLSVVGDFLSTAVVDPR